jgi:hypothetical protein
MAWTLGGERIYVEKDSGWQTKPRIGKIEILDSEQTIIHRAGRPSYNRSIQFVVFSGYKDNILPLCSGVQALVSDQGAEGNVHIESMQAERLRDISRTTPVFRVTMECIKDGS